MDNNKVLTMIEDEMPSVMKKCEKRYRLSEFWFYEDIHDWVFYGTNAQSRSFEEEFRKQG